MDISDDWITMAEIARMAEVKLPAVSNWRRRHQQTFPHCERRANQELFAASEIAAWLDGRKIAKISLKDGELPGTTYGMRFRRNLRLPEKSFNVTDFLWRQSEKYRGFLAVPEYADLVLGLLYLRARYPARWTELKAAAPWNLRESVEHVIRTQQIPLPHLRRAVSTVLSETHGPERLGEIIRLLDSVQLSADKDHSIPQSDWTGPVFDQLLERFVDTFGSHGSVVFTPASVVRVLVELTTPRPGDSVLDPCCDSGGFLIGAASYVKEHGGRPADLPLAGQALRGWSWSISRMNLELHGLSADLAKRPVMAPVENLHSDRRFDVIMTNPPFNSRDWGQPDPADPRWRYGTPSRSNANFAWLQHVVSSLSERGRAAVIMPTSASFTVNDRSIRAAMVDDGVVRAVIALPTHLFASTGVAVNVWLLKRPGRRTADEILLIDARTLGSTVRRAHTDLLETDTRRIAQKWDEWRHRTERSRFQDEPGFAASVPISQIRDNDYILLPSRYVGVADTIQADPKKVAKLQRKLVQLRDRSAEIDAIVDRQLARVNSWTH